MSFSHWISRRSLLLGGGAMLVGTALPPYLTPKPGVSYLDTSSERAEARVAEVQDEIAKIRGK